MTSAQFEQQLEYSFDGYSAINHNTQSTFRPTHMHTRLTGLWGHIQPSSPPSTSLLTADKPGNTLNTGT